MNRNDIIELIMIHSDAQGLDSNMILLQSMSIDALTAELKQLEDLAMYGSALPSFKK